MTNPPVSPIWTRRAFFDSYGETPNQRLAPTPTYGIRISCPCCGYPTLHDRGGFEICYLCWWEDDGQDENTLHVVRGGPNGGYSLEQARLNFDVYLVMYEPQNDTRLGGPDSHDVLELKQSVVAAFEALLLDPSPEHLPELWAAVKAGEKQLHKALKESIRRYERENA